VDTAPGSQATGPSSCRQHGGNKSAVLLNPFCALGTAKMLALKTTLLLLTLLIKARFQKVAGSPWGSSSCCTKHWCSSPSAAA
jgi:hypothetical protein